MASLIPGYEYDIFISYRQKDNRGDRWVSEFVEALKTELESTFKEEISVYFDINPHDGLLETHDVDASLKGKLKCLVFIPVLSRTYCDPNSFAWEHEFKAFIKEACGDKYGLNLKLPNGNITSRILPVRIHNLDPDDVRQLKAQIDIIHPVDFIYYSEGVNRPLRKQDDTAQDTKQLIYRDQVNKTALAIKEIILSLKGEPMTVEKGTKIIEQKREFYGHKDHAKSKKLKFLIGAIVLAIIIAGILISVRLTGSNNLPSLAAKDGRIPIVVMPFQNMTGDTTLNIWQEGIQNILITNLSYSIEDLQVRQLETIEKVLKNQGITDYASITPSVAGLISKKLESNILIQGSMKQSGNKMRFNAQLINTKTGEAFRVFQIDGASDSIFPVIDSLSAMIRKFLIISVMKKEMGYDFNNLEKSFYHSKIPEAFRYDMYADRAFRSGDMTASREWSLKALDIDSNDVTAMRGICYTYSNQTMPDQNQAKQWCLKAYKKRDQLTLLQKLWIEQTYSSFFETPNEELKCLKQIDEYDDQSGAAFMTGVAYCDLQQYDKAVQEFEKWQKYLKLHSEPWEPNDYSWLTSSYIKTGQYRKAKKMLRESEKNFPDNVDLTEHKAIVSLCMKDTVEANRYLEKYKSILREDSISEASISVALAFIYSEAGFLERAEVYLRKALSLEPENWRRMNSLAIFLIDKDISIKEGLGLIEKSLLLNPGRFSSYHWNGWGLFKQGRFEEALKLIEKADSLKPQYDHTLYLHLQAARKAVAEQDKKEGENG